MNYAVVGVLFIPLVSFFHFISESVYILEISFIIYSIVFFNILLL